MSLMLLKNGERLQMNRYSNYFALFIGLEISLVLGFSHHLYWYYRLGREMEETSSWVIRWYGLLFVVFVVNTVALYLIKKKRRTFYVIPLLAGYLLGFLVIIFLVNICHLKGHYWCQLDVYQQPSLGLALYEVIILAIVLMCELASHILSKGK